MQLTAAHATYRSPDWASSFPARATLRELVADTLPAFEAVAVTHGSAGDVMHRLRAGFSLGESFRPQLEANGSLRPGEGLGSMAFASMQLRPRGSAEPARGVERYGDVAIHWRPELLGGETTIAPILSGDVRQHAMFGGGLQAGTSADMVDIVTDALIAQHGPSPLDADVTLPTLLALPSDQARAGVAALYTAPGFRWVSPEAIVRDAAPTADAIEAITFLTTPGTEQHAAIRSWAAERGIATRDVAAPAHDAR